MSVQNFLRLPQRWVDAVHFVVVSVQGENGGLNLHHCAHRSARFCIDVAKCGPCHPHIWEECSFVPVFVSEEVYMCTEFPYSQIPCTYTRVFSVLLTCTH